MAKEKGLVKVWELLKQQDLELQGVNEDGSLAIRDLVSGESASLDPKSIYSKIGVSPDEYDLELNTEDNPINFSPVSTTDRLALGFGNEKGNINYLKKHYGEVKKDDASGGLLVKHKNAWHRVDPSGEDVDPYELSWNLIGKELAGDVAEGVGSALPVAGSIIGGLTSAPAGGLVGGTIGAGTGETLRTYLGKLAGTYDATPEEQASDIGWEMVLNMGGYGVGKLAHQAMGLTAKGGVKLFNAARKAPVVGDVAESLVTIAKEGSAATKEVTAKIMTMLSGQSEETSRFLLADPNNAASVKKFLNGFRVVRDGTYDSKQIADKASDSALRNFESLIDETNRKLPILFKNAENDFLEEAGRANRSFKFNPRQISEDILKQLEDDGVIERVGYGARGDTITMGRDLGVSNSSFSKVFSADDATPAWKVADVDRFLGQGLPGPVVNRVKKGLNVMVGQLNDMYKETGSIYGKEAAEKFLSVRRAFDSVYKEITQVDPGKYSGVMRGYNRTIRDSLLKSISEAKPGVASKYFKMNDIWSNNIDDVVYLKGLKDDPAKVSLNAFRNQVWSIGGKEPGKKALYNKMLDLTGERGKVIDFAFKRAQAASELVRLVPKHNVLGGSILASTAGAAGKFINPILGAGIAIGSSPRAQLALVQKGQQAAGLTRESIKMLLPRLYATKDFIWRLPFGEKQRIIKSDQLLPQMFSEVLRGVQGDEQLKEEIRQQTIFPVNNFGSY